MSADSSPPKELVRVIQRVRTREGSWGIEVVGRVVERGSRPTGSWFAHGRNDRLWLNRLRLEKEDGEIVDLVLDEYTRIIPVRADR